MAGRKAAGHAGRVPDVYLKLVRRFPLRPIRTEREFQEAIEVINALLDRDELDPAEADYLDVLSDLVERYESAIHPIEDAPPSDVLQHLLEAKGTTVAAVARATGVPLTILSGVLSGTKSLGRVHLGKLARHFGVDPGVFAAGNS
jgi:HTH-type transcriptional regulator/antitoxin HigA